MKYRKKPIVIEAVQWTNKEGSLAAIHVLGCRPIFAADGTSNLIIETLEGNHLVYVMDWIIKGVTGDFYPCKQDIFNKIYESIEDK